ncbi:MAG: hypothetical protein VX228_11345, partial [Pseudomonadota bacterium]|nr:hypothetical protein [Pseudomonadota bacterium]
MTGLTQTANPGSGRTVISVDAMGGDRGPAAVGDEHLVRDVARRAARRLRGRGQRVRREERLRTPRKGQQV